MKRYFLSVIAVILFFSCSTQISEETSVVVNLPGTITSRSALDNKRFEIKLTSDTGVFATLSEVSGSKATFNNVEPGDYWVEVRVYDIEGRDKFPVYTGRSGRFTVISGQTAVASVYLRKYKEKIKAQAKVIDELSNIILRMREKEMIPHIPAMFIDL